MLTGVRSKSYGTRYSEHFIEAQHWETFFCQSHQGVMEIAFGMNGKGQMFACYKTPGTDTEQEELCVHQLKLEEDTLLHPISCPGHNTLSKHHKLALGQR